MPASSLQRIRDPLVEKFGLEELPSIAPWVFDEVTAIGAENIEHTLAQMGENPGEPHLMTMWVSAISRNRSDLWGALAQG